MRKLFLAACGLALLSSGLFGQTASTGTVLGTVADATGAVVVGATVTMTEKATNQTLTMTTNDVGQYNFVSVAPGTYRVTVQMAGFRQAAVNDLKVDVSKSYTVNFKMELGAVAEVVEVTAGAGVELQTVDATVGSVLKGDTVLRLPTINRSASALLTIQPLVTPSRGQTDPNFAGQVAGMRSDQNRFNLDGADATDLTSGTAGYFAGAVDWAGPTPTIPVPLESVEEFRVSTTNANATFRGASGGQINLVTKRGTNALHGSGYYYLQNDNLNANTWTNNRLGIKRQELKDKRYGASLGGPIIKNKLFLFGNWESRRLPRQAIVSRLVPTQELKSGILRFPDAGGTVRSYNIRQIDPRGLGISPVVAALWAKFPNPNDLSAGDGLNTGNFTGPADNSVRMDFGVARLDYYFTQNWRMNSSYRYATQLETAVGQVDFAGITGGQSGQILPGGTTPVEPRFFSTTITGSLRPNLISETNIGYKRGWWAYKRINPFPQVPGTAGALMVGQGTLDSGIDVDTQRARSRVWRDQTYSITENMSWIKGKHSVQFGGTYNFFRVFHERDDKVIGSLTSLVYELIAGTAATVTDGTRPAAIRSADATRFNTLFAAATGMVDKAGVIVTRDGQLNQNALGTPMRVFANFHNYEFFVNDVWRISPSLNITAGLTYTIQTPPKDVNGLQTVLVDTATGQDIAQRDYYRQRTDAANAGRTFNPSIGYVPIRSSKRSAIYDIDTNNFGPRIAAAWNPNFSGGLLGAMFGAKKTVLRGGWGMTFDRTNGVGVVMLPILGVGFSQTVNCTGPRVGGTCALTSDERNAFRIGVDGSTVPLPALAKPSIPITPGVAGETLSFSIDPKMQIGRSHSLNFTMQRELPGNMIVEAGYVGRWSNELPQNFQLNAMPLFFKDSASGQTFAQAYDAVARALRGGTAPSNVAAQPFFENQFRGAAVCAPNCTVAFATARGADFRNNQVNNLVNYFNNTVRPNDPFYSRQVTDLFVRGSGGRANYNAGFVSLTKRFGSGLSYTLNYTLSKTLDQYGLNQENIGVVSTPYDLNIDYGPAIFDRTHVFNGQYYYELPVGKGKKFGIENPVLDRVLGGWYFSGIFASNSGLPILATTNVQAFGGAQVFGGLAAGAVPIVPQKYNNSSAASVGSGGVGTAAGGRGSGLNLFSDPAAVYNSLRQIEISRDFRHGRNVFRGLPRWNYDQSIGKRTSITEGIKVVFTADFINIFNRVEFADPALNYFNPTGFGVITAQYAGPRQIQMGLRVEF